MFMYDCDTKKNSLLVTQREMSSCDTRRNCSFVVYTSKTEAKLTSARQMLRESCTTHAAHIGNNVVGNIHPREIYNAILWILRVVHACTVTCICYMVVVHKIFVVFERHI